MTMQDIIAKQVRIERQDASHTASISFDRDAANVFQSYVQVRRADAAASGQATDVSGACRGVGVTAGGCSTWPTAALQPTPPPPPSSLLACAVSGCVQCMGVGAVSSMCHMFTHGPGPIMIRSMVQPDQQHDVRHARSITPIRSHPLLASGQHIGA